MSGADDLRMYERMTDMRRTTLTAAAALLIAGALSGCSATIVDGDASPSAPAETPPAQTAPEPSSAPSDAGSPSTESSTSPGEDDAETSQLSAENAEERERLTASATTTMPCPSGTLDQDGAIIRVEGPCADLVIAIDAGVVIADDVENLSLSGSGTIVYAETIGSLTVTGSASVVHWTGRTPTVDDRGSANTLTRG